jgi:hypothetical protein
MVKSSDKAQSSCRQRSSGPHKTSSGVAEDNENGLGRQFGSRRNAGPLSKRNKFGQRPNLHFVHHPVSVRLDRALGPAQRVGDLLVDFAATAWITLALEN